MDFVGHAKQWAHVLAQWDDGNFTELYPNYPCCMFPLAACVTTMLKDVTLRQVRTCGWAISRNPISIVMCIAALIAASSSPIVALHRQIELEGASAIASGNLGIRVGLQPIAEQPHVNEERQRAADSSAQSQT
jgi:hypothetical protein